MLEQTQTQYKILHARINRRAESLELIQCNYDAMQEIVFHPIHNDTWGEDYLRTLYCVVALWRIKRRNRNR